MVGPAYAYTQLYHVAFQNTIKKAMFFIDSQLQDWTSLTKYDLPDQHHITEAPHHPRSTTTLLLTSNPYDTQNAIQTPPSIQSPPPSFSSSLSSSSSSSRRQQEHIIIPEQYLTLLASEPKKLLQHQRIQRLRKIDPTKSRPLSMPTPPVQQLQRPQTPPPLYYYHGVTNNNSTTPEDEDPYTRATRKWQNRRSCIILPRQEETREDLPPYYCSVSKMAKVFVKMERNNAGKKINRRPWRQVYIELWGTVLKIYPLNWFWATVSNEPMCTISLAGAEAVRAVDYVKRPWVVRLTGHSGIQLLIQPLNRDEMLSWIEHLQSGINISLDLEERPMPKFLTIQPRGGVDTGVLCARMAELERRREQRRRDQQEILA